MSWTEKESVPCNGESGDFIHSHNNKDVLDKIGEGDGTKYLANDGKFKTIALTGAIGDLDGGNALSVFNVEDDVDGGSASSFS